MKPTEQIYANYRTEDFLVWKTLFERQLKNLEGQVSSEFMEALTQVGFHAEAIPDFKTVNKRLAGLTEWQLVTVPEISEVHDFFICLSQKKFTATCWLRSMKQLDYLEEPDMFHDVFGHAPLLSNSHYSAFFESIGKLAARHIHNSEVIIQLQRLYWFTIEFGLIEEKDGIKIFGAGIISSKEETEHAIGNRSLKTRFDMNRILQNDFRTDVLQDEYFVIESFEQLKFHLNHFETKLEEIVVK